MSRANAAPRPFRLAGGDALARMDGARRGGDLRLGESVSRETLTGLVGYACGLDALS